MQDAPAPSTLTPPDSPLLAHLLAQLTVIKAQTQMIRRRINAPHGDDGYLVAQAAAQARSLDAIERAVSLAMTQLIGARELGRMPPEPLVEAEGVD